MNTSNDVLHQNQPGCRVGVPAQVRRRLLGMLAIATCAGGAAAWAVDGDGASRLPAPAAEASSPGSPGARPVYALSSPGDWVYDLGDVWPGTSSPVACTVINDTKRDVILGPTTVTCGCLVEFHALNGRLQPGESTTIVGTAHNLSPQGPFRAAVEFTRPENAAAIPRLLITSNRADCLADAGVGSTAVLGIQPAWGDDRFTISVQRGSRALPWTRLRASSGDAIISVAAEAGDDADTWKVTAILRDRDARVLGPRRVWIDYAFFQQDGRALERVVHRSVAVSVRGPLKANPENLILGVIQAGAVQRVELRFTPRTGAAQALVAVTAVRLREAAGEAAIVSQRVADGAIDCTIDLTLAAPPTGPVSAGEPPFPRIETEVHVADGGSWTIGIPLIYGFDPPTH